MRTHRVELSMLGVVLVGLAAALTGCISWGWVLYNVVLWIAR